MKDSQKKPKKPFVDDGHTVYSMDGLRRDGSYEEKDKNRAELDKREMFAAVRAAFAVYGPVLLGVILCFALTALLLYFWLLK